jgi:carbon monoxide dehydrogenase subunit G
MPRARSYAMRSSGVFEADHCVMIRARASVEAVWEELCDLDRLLGQISTVSSYEVEANGRQGSFVGALTRWPAAWRALPGRAEVIASEPPRRLTWTVAIPDIDFHFTGTFELDAVAAEETNLTYSGVLRCGHRLALRLGSVFAGILEAYMDALATGVASRAARRAAAARALADA